jgi:hypothetical protein
MTGQELADLTDQELVTGAVREMQAIARALLQPDKRDAVPAILKLVEILLRNDILSATERLSER